MEGFCRDSHNCLDYTYPVEVCRCLDIEGLDTGVWPYIMNKKILEIVRVVMIRFRPRNNARSLDKTGQFTLNPNNKIC